MDITLHFVGASASGRLWVVCGGDRDEGVAPTRALPCILWEARPRGDSWWSAGGSRRARRSYGEIAPHFVGAPPSGRLWVVCEGDRDGGVAPTRALPCILWEPRPRGDSWWSAGGSRRGRRSYGEIALHFVGAPPSGRFLVVCGGDRDGGVAPTTKKRSCRLHRASSIRRLKARPA